MLNNPTLIIAFQKTSLHREVVFKNCLYNFHFEQLIDGFSGNSMLNWQLDAVAG